MCNHAVKSALALRVRSLLVASYQESAAESSELNTCSERQQPQMLLLLRIMHGKERGPQASLKSAMPQAFTEGPRSVYSSNVQHGLRVQRALKLLINPTVECHHHVRDTILPSTAAATQSWRLGRTASQQWMFNHLHTHQLNAWMQGSHAALNMRYTTLHKHT